MLSRGGQIKARRMKLVPIVLILVSRSCNLISIYIFFQLSYKSAEGRKQSNLSKQKFDFRLIAANTTSINMTDLICNLWHLYTRKDRVKERFPKLPNITSMEEHTKTK